MDNDQELLQRLTEIAATANADNLADVLITAVEVSSSISDPLLRQFAEIHLHKLRNLASQADIGWKLSSSPVCPSLPLRDIEVIQLSGIIGVLHELAYAFEMVDASSAIGWSGSSATRFYLNSVYHYVSSLFLVDTSKPSHKGLPMGGTIIMVLHPLGLSFLLEPVREVLIRPFGTNTSFGDAILKWRHSYLVHGTFSPNDVEYLIAQTEMRDPTKQRLLSQFAWDLFHQTVILRLRVIALVTAANINVPAIVQRYLTAMLGVRGK